MMPPGSSIAPRRRHRRRHFEVVAAPDLERDVADHEGDADGEQHLRQMVLAGAADQEAVDQEAERDDGEPAAEHAEREAAGVAGDGEADVAAEQVVGAVRHVDDAHQPEASA